MPEARSTDSLLRLRSAERSSQVGLEGALLLLLVVGALRLYHVRPHNLRTRAQAAGVSPGELVVILV
eukprot:16432645-Heterocapsa_arctica.AAC.1